MNQYGETYVIGIDGGGSKTASAILNRQGEVVGRGYSGPSNYHYVGLARTKEALAEAMQMAAQAAGITLNQVVAATWALAGVDRPTEQQGFSQVAAELLPGVP